MMNDSVFLDFAKSATVLNMHNSSDSKRISLDAIHTVHKSIIEGTINLRELTMSVSNDIVKEFINFIGVYFRNDRCFSTNGVEVYEYIPGDCVGEPYDHSMRIYSIFNGNIEISISFGDDPSENFGVYLYET